MKKIILFLFLLTPLMSSTTDTGVYVCTGNYAKAYHKTSDCRGIKSCKSDIIKMSLYEAKSSGKTPCGFCYGN
jgi:hypothetical protein